jgi:hypothetical protein
MSNGIKRPNARKEFQVRTEKGIISIVALFMLFALGTATASAQVDSLVGKYTGIAKVTGSPDTQISLELKNDAGKITGHLMNGETKIEISEGTLSEGKLSLKLGPAAKDGILNGKLDLTTITGEWTVGSNKKTVELKRVGESAGTAAPATFNLSGQWDAVADANGQPFPFLLTLKVDGEKVSGSSSSQLGDANISTGTWKEGKLSLQIEGSNGVTTLNAVVVDGKLSGEFDYAGQLQGKWVAVKKT